MGCGLALCTPGTMHALELCMLSSWACSRAGHAWRSSCRGHAASRRGSAAQCGVRGSWEPPSWELQSVVQRARDRAQHENNPPGESRANRSRAPSPRRWRRGLPAASWRCPPWPTRWAGWTYRIWALRRASTARGAGKRGAGGAGGWPRAGPAPPPSCCSHCASA